jgi:hypothetical protein
MLEEARWNRLIRSVRGSGAARAWYLYKTGRLENGVPDRENAAQADVAGPPGRRLTDVAEPA